MRAWLILAPVGLLLSCAGGSDPQGDGGTSDGGGGTGEPASLAGITQAHNDARAVVGLDPLSWDADLAAIAQAWANVCQDTTPADGFIDHNPGRSDSYPGYVGENIFGSTGPVDPLQAVASWVAEEAHYDLATNTCSEVCGHYTQVVWADTQRVGCAVGSCAGHTFPNVIVCDYSPGGNIVGQWPYP